MKEPQQIRAKVRGFEPNTQNVLATVVVVSGSSYRLPGARMLITETGKDFGTVSGGCLQPAFRDVQELGGEGDKFSPKTVRADWSGHSARNYTEKRVL